jgi:hypothetical protein
MEGIPRKPSGASTHVDVNYFNPDGSKELQRSISRLTTRTQDIELASTGAFDFRKTLEDISQQYVPPSLLGPLLS